MEVSRPGALGARSDCPLHLGSVTRRMFCPPRLAVTPAGPYTGAGEPVAQSVEHLTFNQGVAGSNPAGLTNRIK